MSKVILVLLATALGATDVAAQCWECTVQYWPGDDCYMDSCNPTENSGNYNNCTQQGSCGTETCTPNGGICVPHPYDALDGLTVLGTLRHQSLRELRTVEGLFVSEDPDRISVHMSCNGFLVATFYSKSAAAEIREETRTLTL